MKLNEKEKQQQEFMDKVYSTDIYTKKDERFPTYLEHIQKYKPNKDISILDVGCGPGLIARFLENAGYKNIYGIDYSVEAIKIARNNTKNVEYCIENIMDIASIYGLDTFDVVMCFQTLEHLEQPAPKLLMEAMYKVLKPGGLILLSVPYASLKGNTWHLSTFNEKTFDNYFKEIFNNKPLVNKRFTYNLSQLLVVGTKNESSPSIPTAG